MNEGTTQTTISWRGRMGPVVSGWPIIGFVGRWMMAAEMTRLTARLSTVERNILLRKTTAATLNDIVKRASVSDEY